jgi:hypothetical protein
MRWRIISDVSAVIHRVLLDPEARYFLQCVSARNNEATQGCLQKRAETGGFLWISSFLVLGATSIGLLSVSLKSVNSALFRQPDRGPERRA